MDEPARWMNRQDGCVGEVEINQRKLVVLIPFQLLRLKNIISKNPSRDNFQKLQKLIQNDIIYSIEANLKVGNITLEDADQLRELTRQLYDHLYAHYFEIGGCEEMKPLLEGAMELPGDKYRIRIDELEQRGRQLEAERAKAEEECERLRKENEEYQRLKKENEEYQRLKKENEELKRKMQDLEGQISI
ncbi:hypothetical protein NXH76_11060 [Blautia schinkii]|nr:hypothetical protein [Blautia schinkii]